MSTQVLCFHPVTILRV